MIIFLNGSVNAGKSTVAKMLAQKLPKTANIEIDHLRDFIGWLELDRAIPINLENTCLLIRNFSKHGFNVVVPYPLSQKNYEYMTEQLKDISDQLLFFTLAPSIKKSQTSTEARKISPWERDRIQYHHDTGLTKPSFGIITVSYTHLTLPTKRIV